MATLEDAIALAVAKHHGQKDKNGQPYILHPLRVMFRMTSDAQMMVAILHDVVEDSDVTFDALRQMGYGEHIVEAIDCLTKRDGEPYEGRIARARANPLARAVKIADLEDNMDVRRYAQLPPDRLGTLNSYLKHWHELRGE